MCICVFVFGGFKDCFTCFMLHQLVLLNFKWTIIIIYDLSLHILEIEGDTPSQRALKRTDIRIPLVSTFCYSGLDEQLRKYVFIWSVYARSTHIHVGSSKSACVRHWLSTKSSITIIRIINRDTSLKLFCYECFEISVHFWENPPCRISPSCWQVTTNLRPDVIPMERLETKFTPSFRKSSGPSLINLLQLLMIYLPTTSFKLVTIWIEGHTCKGWRNLRRWPLFIFRTNVCMFI